MQNLALCGYVSHLLRKQHETLRLVVKSGNVGFSGGSTYIYIYVYIHTHIVR